MYFLIALYHLLYLSPFLLFFFFNFSLCTSYNLKMRDFPRIWVGSSSTVPWPVRLRYQLSPFSILFWIIIFIHLLFLQYLFFLPLLIFIFYLLFLIPVTFYVYLLFLFSFFSLNLCLSSTSLKKFTLNIFLLLFKSSWESLFLSPFFWFFFLF